MQCDPAKDALLDVPSLCPQPYSPPTKGPTNFEFISERKGKLLHALTRLPLNRIIACAKNVPKTALHPNPSDRYLQWFVKRSSDDRQYLPPCIVVRQRDNLGVG